MLNLPNQEILYTGGEVTGVISNTVEAALFSSSESEKKYILGIVLNVSAHLGNIVRANVGREEIINILDYFLDTSEVIAADDNGVSVNKLRYLPINRQIEESDPFVLAIQSGATASDLRYNIIYELRK